jgi:hypothetical protein
MSASHGQHRDQREEDCSSSHPHLLSEEKAVSRETQPREALGSLLVRI